MDTAPARMLAQYRAWADALTYRTIILWQQSHGWPFMELGKAGASGKNIEMSPLEFFVQQIVLTGPMATAVWLGGLWGRSLSTQDRDCARLSNRVAHFAPGVRHVTRQGLLPVCDLSDVVGIRCRLAGGKWRKRSRLSTGHCRHKTARARCSTGKTMERRQRSTFGRGLGLPPAISGHNNYYLWGPRDHDGSVMIIVGGRRKHGTLGRAVPFIRSRRPGRHGPRNALRDGQADLCTAGHEDTASKPLAKRQEVPVNTADPEQDGAPGGIRTPDPRSRNPLLYPLSYGRARPAMAPGNAAPARVYSASSFRH